MPEFRTNNTLLLKYLDKQTICKVVRLITEEPQFNDSPNRCFKLPFVATSALCVDNEHNRDILFNDPNFDVLNELMKFIDVREEVQLNSTLCGYFNKIISFWLIKKPNEMMNYIKQRQNLINNLIDHIYLNSSIIDVIVRICCIQGLDNEEMQ